MLPISHILSHPLQPWLKLRDPHLQDLWCVCIIFTFYNYTRMKIFLINQNPISGNYLWRNIPLTGFLRTKTSKLDCKNCCFKTHFQNQTFIFPKIGVLQYVLVYLWVNFWYYSWDLSTRFIKLILYLPILQKMFTFENMKTL